jgi:multidrug efflux pump subunit AcrB
MMSSSKESPQLEKSALPPAPDSADTTPKHEMYNDKPDEKKLGLAGRVAANFIHSPLSPLLFFAMLAMGLMGLLLTPRQEDPQISVPMIDIFIAYPGVDASQVMSLAVEPFERILSEIPRLKHVYSAAERGQAVITLQFAVGEDINDSLIKVHDKIQSHLDLMPPGVMPPLVKPKGIDDVPVINLTLWSEDVDDAALRHLGLELLQRLKQIPNTGHSFLVGGRREIVHVDIEPARLARFNLSPVQLAQQLQAANNTLATGHSEAANLRFALYAGDFLRTLDDVQNLVVASQQGRPVYLRDVARVYLAPEDYQNMVQYYGGPQYKYYHPGEKIPEGAPAVTLAIAKKIRSNGVAVANAILAEVEQLKGVLIPENVHVAVTRDYGYTANEKVNDLIKKLFIATGAVTILVLLALGWQPAVVVTAVIPVVLLMTLFSAMLIGMTVDRVSLFALIFSIGILVDDAIVVVENIYRRWLLAGRMDTHIAIDAVREVGNPTILATFTVVAALLPMGFVTGMMGPYMAPIPVLGSVAMIFSLFAAFAFTPWLAMRIRPSMKALHKAAEGEHKTEAFLEKFFRFLIVPLVKIPLLGWLFLLSLFVAFFASVYLFASTDVTVKMMPYDNKPEFSVVIDLPEGVALTETATVARKIVNILQDIPEIIALQTYVGTARPFDFNGMVRHYYLRAGSHQGEVQVQLLDKKKRKRTSHELAVLAREKIAPLLKDYPGLVLTVVEMPPGPPVLQTVVAEIYGPNSETISQVAKDMEAIFRAVDSLTDVNTFLTADHSVLRFKVDSERAQRLGVSPEHIVRNLHIALAESAVTDLKRGNFLEPTDIIIKVPLALRSQLPELLELPIMSQSGKVVPLQELGEFILEPQDKTIFHKDLREVQYVMADVTGRLGAPIYPMLEVEKRLKDYVTPDGVTLSGNFMGPPANTTKSGFEWAGEWTVTYETFRDMGIAFGVALIAIYILVVWQFGNFIIPLVIMAPIPLTLLGIVPGHWLLGAEFTATSMIGFIALAGIIVRNSILLVDFSIMEVARGVSVLDAVVNACKSRARPILITALALVAGSSVILTDPIFQGMAVSLLFGVLISTFLTLLVIPLGCVSAGKFLKAR